MNQRVLLLVIGSLLPLGCGGDDDPTGLTFATLAVTTSSLPNAAPTVAYSETLLATGGDRSYTWSVTVGSLPTGLSLNTTTGVISGTPTGSGSTFTVQVASGDGQTAAQQLTITINGTLAGTSAPLPNGAPTVAYSETLTAVGGDGNYTWSVTFGSLPSGLSLAANGDITGTPTVAGTQNFTVQVASDDGQTATQALSITVNEPLVVTTTSLPDGVENVDYGTETLTATGGAGSYSWALASGSGPLPSGLSLAMNGDVTGTPTMAETQNFTIQAASDDGQTAQQALSITVRLHFQSVAAGAVHNCGVTTAGATYCWGRGDRGEFGNGADTNSTVPVAVSGGLTFQSLAGGAAHHCGVTTAEAAYCWGENSGGALGNGTTTSSNLPVAVSGGLTFLSLTAGRGYGCGVTTAGVAYCWGSTLGFNFGELGNGTTTGSLVPVTVSGGLTFQSVTAAFDHSCGVTTAGTAYCWGENEYGRLGDGTTTSSLVPVAVSSGLTFQSVTAGIVHSCGLTTAGVAYCWGANFRGQLGDGTTTHSNVPVAVSGGLTFQSVTSGRGYHNCGVTTAGAAYCWGDNEFGRLGDGTTTNSNVPVAVSGGLTLQSVTAGVEHSCGLTTAGVAYCWGRNFWGQLGDGTTTNSNVPVPVG